jgi:uncharacterized protein (TIGR00369 family)
MTTEKADDAGSGLDYLRKVLRAGSTSPMSETMRMRLVAVDKGTATMEGRPDSRYYNPQGRMHGGYVATLIDSALGSAVQTYFDAEASFGTIELKVNFVRKISAGSSPLVCVANVLHSGRTMCTAEAKVTDSEGKLCAHGSGTFLVYPK